MWGWRKKEAKGPEIKPPNLPSALIVFYESCPVSTILILYWEGRGHQESLKSSKQNSLLLLQVLIALFLLAMGRSWRTARNVNHLGWERDIVWVFMCLERGWTNQDPKNFLDQTWIIQPLIHSVAVSIINDLFLRNPLFLPEAMKKQFKTGLIKPMADIGQQILKLKPEISGFQFAS